MTGAARTRYHARMQRVLDHIDQHLDDDLSLATLSGIAAFSAHHFHRQFSACFGISVHGYVQLARLKRASYQLAFGKEPSVTGVAMAAGYESPDAFARVFRKRFGQTPSSFRTTPDWEPWVAAIEPFTNARIAVMQSFSKDDVRIEEFPTTSVAVMEHCGDHGRLRETIKRFIAWRRAVGLSRDISATYTVFHSPQLSPADAFRVDLCAATERPIEANAQAVQAGQIPGGRCAVLRVIGEAENLEAPALFLYRDWLPASGEETRDFPLFCKRISFYPDMPELETVTDLFLPLKS